MALDESHRREIENIARLVAHELVLEQRQWFEKRYGDDLAWAARERRRANVSKSSRRHVIESIVGTLGAAGLLGFLVWFGATIIDSLGHLLQIK